MDPRRSVRHGIVMVVALTLLVPLAAQRRDGRRFGLGGEPRAANTVDYDGRFTIVRLWYPHYGGWSYDYPDMEQNLTLILNELTLVRARTDGSSILRMDDPELMKFPIAYLSEPGYWYPSDSEVAGLRTYLNKGGFLIVDDFVGNHWYNFEEKLKLVLPDARPVKLDVTHPIFDSFFRIESLDFYHPYFQGAKSEFFGVYEDNDPAKRLMIIVNYNNDMAEYWEWSDVDFAPIELTNEAYKLGINYVIYAMTH